MLAPFWGECFRGAGKFIYTRQYTVKMANIYAFFRTIAFLFYEKLLANRG